MNVDKLLNDAVRLHNLTNPDFIIHKTLCDSLTFYFLFCKDGNIWNSDECTLFLYLYDKLSQDRIYPFIALQKINGEDKIGIFIDATKNI